MGSSGWSYFVPYQQDIGSALEQLRQDVFERGDYLLLDDWTLWNEVDERIDAGEDHSLVEADRLAQRDALAKPSSIDELFEWNEEAGTHSIIDMIAGVSETPAFGTVSPMTQTQLIAAFSTTRPTHPQIDQLMSHGDPVGGLRRRWEGLYIIVYKDNTPSELFFTGFSGD